MEFIFYCNIAWPLSILGDQEKWQKKRVPELQYHFSAVPFLMEVSKMLRSHMYRLSPGTLLMQGCYLRRQQKVFKRTSMTP
jgi:hypothetical protein